MKSYANSDIYEELIPNNAKSFFAILGILPFALILKIIKTLFRMIGVILALAAIVPTFGRKANQEFLFERVSSLGRDLADWVIYPFALIRCLLSSFQKNCV